MNDLQETVDAIKKVCFEEQRKYESVIHGDVFVRFGPDLDDPALALTGDLYMGILRIQKAHYRQALQAYREAVQDLVEAIDVEINRLDE